MWQGQGRCCGCVAVVHRAWRCGQLRGAAGPLIAAVTACAGAPWPVRQEELAALADVVTARAPAAEQPAFGQPRRRGPQMPQPDFAIDAIVSQAEAAGSGTCWFGAPQRCWRCCCCLPLPPDLLEQLARHTSVWPDSQAPALALLWPRPAEDLQDPALAGLGGPAGGEAEGEEEEAARYPEPPQRSYRLPQLLRLAGLEEQVGEL